MVIESLSSQVERILSGVKRSGCYRNIEKNTIHDDDVIDFTTNDYLGLRKYSEEELIDLIYEDNNPELINSLQLYKNYSAPFGGSTGSRLISGNNNFVRAIENYFEQQYSESSEVTKSCLIFNSGYHANVGIIPALCELSPNTLVIFDQLSHASIIDGVLLANVNFKRFRHNNLEHLESILESSVDKYNNIIIAIESVYSMDGDGLINLSNLAILKSKYSEKTNIILYCDEAHAVGLFGSNGLGRVEDEELIKFFDIVVAPCGKALNSYGALVFSSTLLKDFLINRCRTFIYTTALPPELIKRLFLNYLVINTKFKTDACDELMAQAELLRNNIIYKLEQHFHYIDNISDLANYMVIGEHQITGLILGSNEAVLKAKDIFLEHNILISAIRYPTVPKGKERIRLSLSFSESLEEEVDLFMEAFDRLLLDDCFQSSILSLSTAFSK